MFWGQALIEFRRTNKARSWPNFLAWHLKTDSKSAFATSFGGSRSPPSTTSFGISAFDMSRGTHPPTLPMSSRMHHFPNRHAVSAAKEGSNMKYQIQGLSIHAEVHGTAEPALVFLHYWGGTSRTWRKVTAELEGQFKTVAYDARGWGKSDKTLAGYKLADLADEALSLVKAGEM